MSPHALSNHIQSGFLDEPLGLGFVAEQRFDLPSQLGIVAGLIEEGRTLVCLPLQSSVVDPSIFFQRSDFIRIEGTPVVPSFLMRHISPAPATPS